MQRAPCGQRAVSPFRGEPIAAVALASALAVLAPASASPRPAAAPDAWTICMTDGAAAERRVAQCTRALKQTDLSRFHRFLLTSARGDAELDLGRDRAAVADYDRAVRLDPRESDTYASRGEAKEALHRPQAAERDYDAAIHAYLAQPNNADNGTADVLADDYAMRGRVRLASGHPQQALRDFRRALALYPVGATPQLREQVREATRASRRANPRSTTSPNRRRHGLA